jgi:tetratricopeptide (TPR) repeat protein
LECIYCQSILKYYNFINNAESAAYQNDIDKAIQNYKQAFRLNDSINFSSDLFNYAYLCIRKGLFNDAYNAFEKVISRGYSCYQLKNRNDSIFQSFLKTDPGRILLEKCESIPLDKDINENLRERIFNLKVLDQKFRKFENAHSIFKDSIIKYDHIIVDSLLNIFREFDGIPSERILGVDTISLSFPIYFIPLFHQSEGMFSTKYDYSKEIVQAVHKGNINNRIAADLLQRANSKFNFGEKNFMILKLDSIGNDSSKEPSPNFYLPSDSFCIGLVSQSDSAILKINEMRANFYLMPLQDQLKIIKSIVLLRTEVLPVNIYNLNIFSMENIEVYNEWCKKLLKL